MRTEILILGGGVIGSSVAWHLAQRGLRDICVIDRGDQLGTGSTGKATGGYRAQFDNETEIRLSLLAKNKLLRFSADTGVDPGYTPSGYLFLACSAEELDALATAQKLQHACGLTEARMVSAAEARALSPAISDDTIVGGAFCPSDGFIKPMEILRGYASGAQRMGVRYQFGVEVRSLDSTGDRVLAVETSAGRIETSIVINAMGAWSGAPVTPLRRKIAATVATSIIDDSMPMTIWSADWFHFRSRDGRALLLWPDDPPDDEKWMHEIERMTRLRARSLSTLAIEEVWSGFYEMSPDEHVLLGRSPDYTNLYLATGASGHGVMHSPALGQLLAEMIVDGAPSLDVRALDPRRFVGT
jgi:sarcosine oxidase subunit beta